jgi:hypothetical protein
MPNMWTRWLIACLSLAGCGAGSASEAEPARTMDSPGVVDSAFTPEEQLRRFTEGLEVPAELARGSASREALVRRYVDALQSHDTSAIREMTLSRAEFAYLHYPGSPYARPPMRQDPALVWFQIQQNSEKGIVRALRQYGGEQLGYHSHRCAPDPEVQNDARMWTDCVVVARFGEPDTTASRLFGTIMERRGVWKFVSYANRL